MGWDRGWVKRGGEGEGEGKVRPLTGWGQRMEYERFVMASIKIRVVVLEGRM